MNNNITVFKALSDTTRLQILNCLLKKPNYLEEITERLGLPASTASFHLKKLEEAGLISKSREQYYTIFKVEERLFGSTLRELIGIEDIGSEIEDRRIEEYKEKVLRTFFKDGVLIKMPAQYKKRLIVLEIFSALFEPETEYKENDVNEKISLLYYDYTGVRRMLIDEGMMIRHRDIYELAYNPDNSAVKYLRSRLTKPEGKEMSRNAELKRNYKESVIPMGVIAIRNNANGKTFVVSAKNIEAVINKHKFTLKHGVHTDRNMQEDWNKYGPESFTFEVIDQLEPKKDGEADYTKELKVLEEMWAEKLDAYEDRGYNKRKKR